MITNVITKAINAAFQELGFRLGTIFSGGCTHVFRPQREARGNHDASYSEGARPLE